MRFWLLVLCVGTLSASEIGGISEIRGNGEITRVDSSEALTAELNSDIFSYDDVRTGKGRLAIQFLDDSVVKLTEHSKLIIDELIKHNVSIISLVPTMLSRIIKSNFTKDISNILRAVIVGGADCSENLIKDAINQNLNIYKSIFFLQ